MSTSNPSMPTRPSRITDNDHGPGVIISAGVMLGTTVIALMMRLYQRWPWSRLAKAEDALLVAATISSICNIALIALAVQHGLGQRADLLSTSDLSRTRDYMIASFSVTFVTEALSAISFLTWLRTVNHPRDQFRYFTSGLSVVVGLWALAGLIRFAASSSHSVPSPTRHTWIGFGVVSICIQLSLFTSALWTIWVLHMPIAKKLGLSLWFGLCLPVVAVTITRLVFTPADTFSPTYTWDDTNMVIISLIESNLTIINAAYPSVRQFLGKVSTGFLVAETAADSKSGSRFGSKGNSFALQSIGGGPRGGLRVRDAASINLEKHAFANRSTAGRGDARSDKSFGSEAIMVRRSVEIDERSLDMSRDMQEQ